MTGILQKHYKIVTIVLTFGLKYNILGWRKNAEAEMEGEFLGYRRYNCRH